MTLNAAVYSFLSSALSGSSVDSDRIAPLVLPHVDLNAAFPDSVSWSMLERSYANPNITAPGARLRATVEIAVLSELVDSADVIRDLIRSSMNALYGGGSLGGLTIQQAKLLSEADGVNDAAQVVQLTATYEITYVPA